MDTTNLGNADHASKDIIYIIFLSTLVVFVLVGSIMESKHLPFGHETGFIIPFGMLISFIAYQTDSENFKF